MFFILLYHITNALLDLIIKYFSDFDILFFIAKQFCSPLTHTNVFTSALICIMFSYYYL